MKKITYLGMGAWGYCLASLLSNKYSVACWTTKKELAEQLQHHREHPFFPGIKAGENMTFTDDLEEALQGAEAVVESVTSSGVRPVFERVKTLLHAPIPIILTSKGIEQKTGEILPEIVAEVMGEPFRPLVGFLSGPGFAKEVIRQLPTSLVATGFSPEAIRTVTEMFTTPFFRVYPNADITGVAFGGALKNIIAIACGISDGLNLGNSARAALVTRGLHEIKKLSLAFGACESTIYGLSGMGDLCLTCSSPMSRNFHFGFTLAQGLSPQQAEKEVGMVVEGVYTCVSALEVAKKKGVEMPIAEGIYEIVYQGRSAKEVAKSLMQRAIKEEHL